MCSSDLEFLSRLHIKRAVAEQAVELNIAAGSTNNINKVYLTYSNNPKDESSIGKTPESTPVYVYTYQLNNTKYHDDDNPNNVLAGAGFRLYSDEACHDEDEIKLKMNDDDTYSRDFSTEGKGVEMISGQDGQFNVKGLDAGTYYLKETKTPDRKSTRLNSSHITRSRMPSSA